MKKRFQVMALLCMTYIQELTIVAMVVLVLAAAIIYVAGSVLTNTGIVMVVAVALVSFLPVLIGGLYEFCLSPSNWFLRDGDDGKL